MTRTPLVFGCLVLVVVGACTLETRPSASNSGGVQSAGVTGVDASAGTGAGSGGMSEEAGASAGQAGVAGSSAPKLKDGETCAAAEDCASGNCSQNTCCASGDCCRTANDCPKTSANGVQLACNNPSQCQGAGGSVTCQDFRCVAMGDEANDSACTSQHKAKDCAPYKPVYCNGQADQREPTCPTSCKSDADCNSDARCNDSGVCVHFVPDGGSCKVDADCSSDHCSNGVCCQSGDCCTTAEMCANYAKPARCTDATRCDGERSVAACTSFQCRSQVMPDHTACNRMKAADCGLYADAICSDRAVAPVCAKQCMVSAQCKPNAYCNAPSPGQPGQCVLKRKDGAKCSASEQCEVTCNNGVCCHDSGPTTTCCATSEDCRKLESSGCVDDKTCAGQVTTASCGVEFRCEVKSVSDPGACTQEIDCGPGYAHPLLCSVAQPTCSCRNVSDCAENYVCVTPVGSSRGQCTLDVLQGGAGAAGMMTPAAGQSGSAAGGGGTAG